MAISRDEDPNVSGELMQLLFLENRNRIGEALCRAGERFGACPKLDEGAIVPVPFGCGYFGCVFPTEDPGIVLKITTDPSEAAFASTIIGKAPKTGGIARYFAGYRIPGLYGLREGESGEPVGIKERVFAFWREGASPAGLRIPADFSRAKDLLSSAAPFREERFTREDVSCIFDEFLNLIEAYRRAARKAFDHYAEALSKGAEGAWRAESRKIAKDLAKAGPEDFSRYGIRVISGSPLASTYEFVILNMFALSGNLAGKNLGDFLGTFFFEKYFLFADVRLANLGMIPSSEGPALIDPGLAIYFGTQKLPKLPELPLK